MARITLVLSILGVLAAGVLVESPATASAPTRNTAIAVPAADPAHDAFEQMKADLGLDGMKNQEDLNAFRAWLNVLPKLSDEGFYEAAIDIPVGP